MTTTISGLTVGYTAEQIIDNSSSLIIRTPIASTNDDFSFAGADLITASFGVGNGNVSNNGYSVDVTIQNATNFTITQTCTGTGLTCSVAAGLEIPAQASRTFSFILTDFTLATWNVDVRDYYEALVLRQSDPGANTCTILSPPTYTGPLNLILPPNAGAFGDLLQTDGLGSLSWFTEPPIVLNPYAYAYGPAVPTPVTAAFATVLLDTSPVIDPAFTLAGGVFTNVGVDSGGVYEANYWAQFESVNRTGSARASLACRLVVNGVPVLGSAAECYLREQNGNVVRPGCGKTVLITLPVNSTVVLEVSETFGTATGDVRANQCSLVLIKLRS